MVTLQSDILEIYNSLSVFSNDVIKSPFPKPITVFYNEDTRSLVFELSGKVVMLPTLNYYCLDLKSLTKATYLLPEGYDYLMYNLQTAINSGKLLEDRTCLSPENYGFDLYFVNQREIINGPDIIAKVRFISGKSKLFKLITKLKYKL